jgi:2-isopropylmalate synthase
MDPADVGVDQSLLTLTARSGRAALSHHLKRLGFTLSKDQLDTKYHEFIIIADKKKEVHDDDLLVMMGAPSHKKGPHLDVFQVVTGTSPITPTATVTLTIDGTSHTASSTGNGPIDAAFKSVNAIVKKQVQLDEYLVQAITGGSDDLGKVHVQITCDGRQHRGFGSDTDVIIASVKAYVDALHKTL